MRLWTLHPKYLDTKGLLAVWREALLAQKVLKGETKGYRHHPQLRRFTSCADPIAAIASYLRAIHVEATRRGYQFDGTKITPAEFDGRITCTRGQLVYEWERLKEKVKQRDEKKSRELDSIADPQAHPLFRVIKGEVEDWEVRKPGTL